MEMDGGIKGKVVVNDKLGIVSSIKSWLGEGTDLYIVSIIDTQQWPWELPIAQNDISRLAIGRSDFPRKIDFKEDVSAKRKRRVCQKAYSRKRSTEKHC